MLFYIASLQGHWILDSSSIDVDPATWVNDYELYPLNDQTPRQGAERATDTSRTLFRISERSTERLY